MKTARLLTLHAPAALALLAALGSPAQAAQTWYVTGGGDDAHAGKTAVSAFRTLKKAEAVVQAGDTVLIGDGIYTDPDTKGDSAVVTMNVSGTPQAWITWKAMAGQHPVVRPVGWNGIVVAASYQILDGLTVIGNNDAITLKDALADEQAANPDPHFNTNGIFINGRKNASDAKPHHVIVRHCTVGKCSGGGIAGIETDYLTVEDCKVYDNAWYSRYGCSGITTANNWAHDNLPGYHDLFLRNIVWNNKGLVPWKAINGLSDGNGIILDVSDQDNLGPGNPTTNTPPVPAAPASPAAPVTAPAPVTATSPRPTWVNGSLIANNLCAYNGGSGIHTFRTRHVDIVNNTTYWNGQVVGYAEVFANHSTDVNILNNIMVPRPNGSVTSNNRNTNVRFDYNLYSKAQTVLVGAHDIVGDPGFIDIDADPTRGNFHLAKNSLAIGSGTAEVPQAVLLSSQHTSGKPDRGAY